MTPEEARKQEKGYLAFDVGELTDEDLARLASEGLGMIKGEARSQLLTDPTLVRSFVLVSIVAMTLLAALLGWIAYLIVGLF